VHTLIGHLGFFYSHTCRTFQQNVIICLVESKTDDRDEIKLPGYIFKLKNQKKIAKVKSGGILLGLKDK
jgi:hypothetical protein